MDAFDYFLSGYSRFLALIQFLHPAPFFFFFKSLKKEIVFSPFFVFEQDILEYKKKQRPQKIKMLDGAVKTIMVDDSKTVGELLVTICSRIGTQLI